jgi:site-specific DNA-adenine methylase
MNSSTARNGNCQYNYDFNYSITPDLAKYPLSTEETALSTAAAQLAESTLIRSRDVAQFWSVISRQAALLRLGGQV